MSALFCLLQSGRLCKVAFVVVGHGFGRCVCAFGGRALVALFCRLRLVGSLFCFDLIRTPVSATCGVHVCVVMFFGGRGSAAFCDSILVVCFGGLCVARVFALKRVRRLGCVGLCMCKCHLPLGRRGCCCPLFFLLVLLAYHCVRYMVYFAYRCLFVFVLVPNLMVSQAFLPI